MSRSLLPSSIRQFAAIAALATAGLVSPACAASAESAGAARTSAKGGDEVVAEVGGKPITMTELETALAPQLSAIDRQRRQILEDGIENVVEEKLLEAEAAARGVTIDQLFATEIEAKAGEVSDEEVTQFYEANKARINRPIEQISAQIRNYLANQKRSQLRNDLVAGLRGKYATRILLEPVRADVSDPTAPAKGPASAPVTIVEFSDFQCPYCSRVVPSIDQALETYGDQVRLVYRQFPLNIHPNAQKAAEASLCANDQGKFWELHDAMFANQRELGVDQLKSKAVGLGLDAETFNACLDSGKYAAKVAADVAAGAANGVNGTPAMFVNGRFLNGAVPFEQIARLIDDELSRKGITPKKNG